MEKKLEKSCSLFNLRTSHKNEKICKYNIGSYFQTLTVDHEKSWNRSLKDWSSQIGFLKKVSQKRCTAQRTDQYHGFRWEERIRQIQPLDEFGGERLRRSRSIPRIRCIEKTKRINQLGYSGGRKFTRSQPRTSVCLISMYFTWDSSKCHGWLLDWRYDKLDSVRYDFRLILLPFFKNRIDQQKVGK